MEFGTAHRTEVFGVEKQHDILVAVGAEGEVAHHFAICNGGGSEFWSGFADHVHGEGKLRREVA